MSQNIGLREAERQVFRLATFQDGWWDIYLGGVFVALSFYPITRSILGPVLNAVLVVGIMVILLAVMYAVKRTVVAPRLGRVRLGPAQKARTRRLNVLALVLVLATLTLWVLTATRSLVEPTWAGVPAWVSDLDVDILFTAIMIGFFSLGAYTLGVPRLHLYGWLLGLGNLAATALHLYAGVSFHLPVAIAGGIILLIGVVLFVRFLRDYPIPVEEV